MQRWTGFGLLLAIVWATTLCCCAPAKASTKQPMQQRATPACCPAEREASNSRNAPSDAPSCPLLEFRTQTALISEAPVSVDLSPAPMALLTFALPNEFVPRQNSLAANPLPAPAPPTTLFELHTSLLC